MELPPKDLLTNEDSRLTWVMGQYSAGVTLQQELEDKAAGDIRRLQQIRIESLRYIATIAAGAASLSPQLIGFIQQGHFFYMGVGSLCLSVIIGIVHSVSAVENDITRITLDIGKAKENMSKIQAPQIEFLRESDRSPDALLHLFEAHDGLHDIFNQSKEKKDGWYSKMDYTAEYLVFFFTSGLALLTLGLTKLEISWLRLGMYEGLLLCFVVILATFPRGIFIVLGSPFDLTKSVFRCLWKKIKR